jgi:hypothetical protein
MAPAIGQKANGLVAAFGAPLPDVGVPPACPVMADSIRLKEAMVSGSAAMARNWSCQRSRYRFASSCRSGGSAIAAL